MDTKTKPYICCLQETHLETRDTYRLKVKGWKKIFHANRDQKKAGIAILVSDKIDFKTKAVKRDKEGHYIMIKVSIQEEDITIINIYAPNIAWGPGTEETLTPCEAQHTARCTNRRRRLCDPPRENLTPGLCGPRHSFWPFSKLFLFGHLEKLSKWNLLSPWESARHTVPKQALSLSQFLGSSALLTFLPRKCSSLKALHCTCPRA